MDSQIKLILFLLNLFVGFWVIGFIYFRFRLYYSQYLKKVLQYIVLFNIFLFIFFILKYFDINIWRQELSFKSSTFLTHTFPLFFLAICLTVFSMFEIFLAFNCKELRKRTKLLSFSAITLFVVSLFIGLNFAVVYPSLRFLFTIVDNLFGVLFLLEILILVSIFVKKDSLCISTKIRFSVTVFCYTLPYQRRM